MSIPTPFNPMGTLGAELPFVQPIMTSNDTWDTTLPASCGMVLTGVQTQESNAKWMAFDGNDKTIWSVFSNGGIMTIDFEQPVKITMLHISSERKGSSSATFSCVLRGGDRELGRYNGLGGPFDIISDNPSYSKTYTLSIVPDVSGMGWYQFREIKINGFIKA